MELTKQALVKLGLRSKETRIMIYNIFVILVNNKNIVYENNTLKITSINFLFV
jgi:hypothetical protein